MKPSQATQTNRIGDDSSVLDRREFMTGTAIATLAALMLGARQVEAAQGQEAKYRADPRYVFADRISDLVIPRTDTGGASDAGAAAFMLLAFDAKLGGLDPAMLEQVRTALDVAASGQFMQQSRSRQHALLEELDRHAFTTGANSPVDKAWPHVKAAILASYYTSEIGASKELVYDPVPGVRENITLTPDFRMSSIGGAGPL